MTARPRTSLWAVASLLVSVLLVPPMCLVGPVLGLVGVVQTRDGRCRGRKLAIAAIIIGFAATLGWVALFSWWHINVRTPMIEGPRTALAQGLAGDVAGFRSAFEGGMSGDGTDAAAFLSEIQRRYGTVVSMRQDDEPTAEPRTTPGLDGGAVTIPYQVRFERGAVRAEARFIVRDANSGSMVLRWAWLRIPDADSGDLVYPGAADAP